MRKIIKGKKYDTETAKLIGGFTSSLGQSDFRYYAEQLYLKKTGEYFIFGEGHGLSKYCSSNGNCTGWGNEIIPMSPGEAFAWAYEKSDMSVDEIESHFGEIKE